MKIVHIGLGNHFTEEMKYQDNELSEQNVRDGHEVLYISDAEKYENGRIVSTDYEDKILANGVRLIRLKYVYILTPFITDKIRAVKGLYNILREYKPDVILSHNIAYFSIIDVVKYKKKHQEVKLYADTHITAENSAKNWLSKFILHKIFYKSLIQYTLRYLEKYLYIGAKEKNFSIECYGVPECKMQFFPLGTRIIADDEYKNARKKRRNELGIAPEELLLIHSGKINELKKTDILIKAFHAVQSLKAKLVIIGVIEKKYEEKLFPIMNEDSRILCLGWKSGEELMEYLCAGDLYCQPGSVSATLQHAIGCHNAVLCNPNQTYKIMDEGNFLWVESEYDIKNILESIEKGEILIKKLKRKSELCAHKYLDYAEMAKIIYQ